MTIQEYIDRLNAKFKTGISREQAYRGDLQSLLESIAADVLVINEPAGVDCGKPDYIITKQNIPVGYIEAKDIGTDLDSKAHKEQFDRYRQALHNLIITDYLSFQLFRDGESVSSASISIGQIQGKKIIGTPENYFNFIDLIRDFCTHTGQTIRSASKLSKMMAGKARLLTNVIEKALLTGASGDQTDESDNITLQDQYKAFREILIHDMNTKTFADIYAQTIAYGMFAARLNDPGAKDFSRKQAAEFIPKSNPFLRKLFHYIAGIDLDDRIKWIVDALADIFRATDVIELLKDFGKATQQNDPVIHFYETFLSEYDPALRKSRGVWYTPEPVVNFIVRAADEILKTDFGLKQGIADRSKTKIRVDVQGKKVEQEVHKVQILDPAAGTGSFLAEVVKHIYRQYEGQQGIWNNYVEEHLIPRLNGFEILMASYAMAHLKLDLLLRETGCNMKKNQRLRIYLTNSLEEHHPDTGTLFAQWLSTEANEANYIKRDTPVMVVLGNPPYSVSSSNKSKWIQNLIADYKKDLNERNIQPLSDDYIKFIRFGQHFIDKNERGVLAYISNNSFIDGIIHRQMRKHLSESFDKIFILDLHGNTKKKEVCPDGSTDQNVFDIMQGVSINIFVKKTVNNKKKAQVFHFNLYGKREDKYDFLNRNSVKSINWNELDIKEPYYFFVPKNFEVEKEYNISFCIDKLFQINTSGIKTHDDNNLVSFTRFTNSNQLYYYRPFDIRNIEYNLEKVQRHRYSVMKFMLKENLSLMTCRQQSAFDFQHVLVSKLLVDMCSVSLQTKETAYAFPLYLYPETSTQQAIDGKQERKPNLNMEIVNQIAGKLGLRFTPEKDVSASSASEGTFAPIDILDYIYAVLHSPTYRKKYKEFLKIDFPRVPYPKDAKTFWQLVTFGGELRQIHLLESPAVEKRITTYPQAGENIVVKPRFENGRVWINDEQYFDNVPEIAWKFYIGGYQPAQKWLRDRKGRKLIFDDIEHYQKIIAALSETDAIMKKIDGIDSV